MKKFFFLHRRWLAHVFFWIGVLAFYTLYFSRVQNGYRQSFLFVCLLLPITIATTYFLLYFLIPRYLFTRRYGRFALYSLYTLVTSIHLELVVVIFSFVFIAEYQVGPMNTATRDVLNLVVGMYLVVFVAVAANLFKRWYAMQAAHAQLQSARIEAALKLREAELKLLRAQINPHFLFNTLNNLYGLTLERSEQAPDVVLRLSDLLDYVLYRCNTPRVPLNDEIQYVRNYLALETLRYNERVQITFDTTGLTEHACIAPMLLIPFVENSFKHGLSQVRHAGHVRIALSLDEGTMTFTVENSVPPKPHPGTPPPYTEGIGLQNVRKRLALLYPDAHTLTVEDHADAFRITLTLQLDDAPCRSAASS